MASAASVLKKFFGLKDGQTLSDFAGELKQLTDEDKEQLVQGITDESFSYE